MKSLLTYKLFFNLSNNFYRDTEYLYKQIYAQFDNHFGRPSTYTSSLGYVFNDQNYQDCVINVTAYVIVPEITENKDINEKQEFNYTEIISETCKSYQSKYCNVKIVLEGEINIVSQNQLTLKLFFKSTGNNIYINCSFVKLLELLSPEQLKIYKEIDKKYQIKRVEETTKRQLEEKRMLELRRLEKIKNEK